LTKDIPTAFIKEMTDRLEKEIYRQSFVPDIDNLKFSGAASGIAIDKFLYILEYVAVEKQSYFEIALRRRFDLINKIQALQDIENIDIAFSRNTPQASEIEADIYTKLDGRGISRETLITNLIRFVDNAKEELERAAKEEEQRMKSMESFEEPEQEIEEPEEEENE
jgi:SPP1 family phage portal protein